MRKPIDKINLSVKNGKGKVITNGSVANILIDFGKVKGGTGGTGGGNFNIAYCEEDAPDSDEITCYLGADLEAWDGARTYITNEWVIVGGTEYKSLQNDNLNHIVTDTDWWEVGTAPTITVKCLIANGSSLMYASPFLKDGQPIPVNKKGDEWYCTNLFNGVRFLSFGV